MLQTKSWMTTLAAAGVLALGGLTAMSAQEAEEPGLDVDAMAERMELGEEARADLAQLDDLLQQRRAMHEGMVGLHEQMSETMQGLRSNLTADQFQQLHQQMRATMPMGPRGGQGMHRGGQGMHRGGMMNGGHMRGMQGQQGSGQAMPGPGMHRGPGMGARAGECPYLQQDGDTGDDTP